MMHSSPTRYSRLLLFCLSLLFGNSLYAGGPWTQPQGKGYFKLSEYWILFDQHFNSEGTVVPNTTTGIFNTTLYAEYGILDRFSASLYFPVLARTYYNNEVSETTGEVLVPGEELNTVGDLDFGLKYRLTKEGAKWPMAISAYVGIPLGETSGGSLGRLQTGDGEFNQILRFDAGTSYDFSEKISGYSSFYAAFNNRTKEYSEEVRVGVESGIAFLERDLWFILRLADWESLQNGSEGVDNPQPTIYANNQAFTSFTIEAAYYIKKGFGVSAAFGGAFRAERVAAAPSFNVGLFYDMTR